MYRSTISGSSYGLLASALSQATYSDQSVISGTIYYYVVTVVNDTGQESTYSNETRVTVP
jgi:fibronectin type 3 domain-containing protein